MQAHQGSIPTAADLGLSEHEYQAHLHAQLAADGAGYESGQFLPEVASPRVFPHVPFAPRQYSPPEVYEEVQVTETGPQRIQDVHNREHLTGRGKDSITVGNDAGTFGKTRGGDGPARRASRGSGRSPKNPNDPRLNVRVDVDAEYAAELQRMEIAMAAQADAREERHASGMPLPGAGVGRASNGAESIPEGSYMLEDPVWGTFIPKGPPGAHFRPMELVCVMCCPCAVPPCTASRRSACRVALSTWSVGLVIVQSLLWVLSVCFRGFAPFAVNPMLGPWPDTLDMMQAKNSAALVYRYEVWRLLTPVFLHAGFIHLGANVLMQLKLGLYTELLWGPNVWCAVYFGSGVMGSLWSAVLKPETISVGSSGALMGILGGWMAHLLETWGQGGGEMQASRSQQLIMAVVNVAVILSFSFSPNIDWSAHVGGLVGGFLLGQWFFQATAGPLNRPVFTESHASRVTGSIPAPGADGGERRPSRAMSVPWGTPRPSSIPVRYPADASLAVCDPGTQTRGLFNDSGKGLLLDRPVYRTARAECCPCAVPDPGVPGQAASSTYHCSLVSARMRSKGGVSILLYVTLLLVFTAVLWTPGGPVRPPTELLNMCETMAAIYAGYAKLRCPW